MRKGFTLIELLIVIAIIGILAVVFLPSILNSPAKSRDTDRIADIKRIADFFTAEYVLTGKVVPGSACLNPDNGSDAVKAIKGNIDKFNGIFPLDPGAADHQVWGGCMQKYGYIKDPNGVGVPKGTYSFGVYALMETFGAANAECSVAWRGTIKAPSEAASPTTWCYAILVQ